jgi:quercetin dioxygenase-like cupin family protein
MKKVPFSNKKVKPVFTDARGDVFDILEDKIGHIGIVTFRKGAVRGNHYHKKSIQYSYVLDGKVELTVSHVDGSKKRKYILTAGTLTTIPPHIAHTYRGLTKASMLDMTTLSRTGNGYENDTVRVR